MKPFEENVFRGWTVAEAEAALIPSNHQFNSHSNFPKVALAQNLSPINWAGYDCYGNSVVQNQGSCGDCWAFATSEMLTDRCCITKQFYSLLSPQELLDCTIGTCSGGDVLTSVNYISSVGGLVTIDCLPYNEFKSSCPQWCSNNPFVPLGPHYCKCNSFVSCEGLSGIQSCLVNGPITGAMHICQSFYSYGGGYYSCDCGTSYTAYHFVEIVGWGYGSDYTGSFTFLYIKNSWGSGWGASGYFYLRVTAPYDDCGIINFSLNYGSMACDQFA